jgi:hypothetical protein
MQELTVSGIYVNAFKNGLRNVLPLVANTALWALTLWIPYLNVGTTIGLVSLPAKMSRGEMLSPVEIFDRKYRRQMGEFFLVLAFMVMGTLAGYLFGIIPGIVIQFAWMLAPLLVIDRSVNPSAALQASNNLTYGKKWTIFFGILLIQMTSFAGFAMVSGVGFLIHRVVGAVLALLLMPFLVTVALGANAHIYGTLIARVPVKNTQPQAEHLRPVGT